MLPTDAPFAAVAITEIVVVGEMGPRAAMTAAMAKIGMTWDNCGAVSMVANYDNEKQWWRVCFDWLELHPKTVNIDKVGR